MHADAHYHGRTIYGHADRIAQIVKDTGAQTILDYGSGKGRQYLEGRIHMLWGGILPTLYDPGCPGIDRRPRGTFDAVLCVDVMEHVPEDEVNETLVDIRNYARMWCFFAICCEPAKKLLPDGRNAHETVRPPEWWRERLNRIFWDGPDLHTAFEMPPRTKPHTAVKCKRMYRELGWVR